MIYIENTGDKQRIYIPRSAVEVEYLSPIPDELMGDYYTKQQVDNKVLDLQGQINTTNVEVQELDERVTAIENNGTGGGGGSVDNEEIEKINQSIDALDERLTQMDLIQYFTAIDGGKLSRDTVIRIAEQRYSTDYYIKGVTIDGVSDAEVHILWRSKIQIPNLLLPTLPSITGWRIWGLYYTPMTSTTQSPIYMVMWTVNSGNNSSADIEPTIKKIALTV